jgi:hypothetical protein
MFNAKQLQRTLVLASALAALVAPTASARPADAQPAGTQPSAAQAHSNQDLRSPDTRDHAIGRGTFSAPEVTVVKVTEPAPPSSGLDWGDAGVGAGGMLGLILLALASVLAIVHHRRSVAGTEAAPIG